MYSTVYMDSSGTTVMLHGMMSMAPTSGNRDRGAHREMNRYRTLLEEALMNGRVCLEVCNGKMVDSALTCLCLPRQWVLFMKKVYDSFTKVHFIVTYTAYMSIVCL